MQETDNYKRVHKIRITLSSRNSKALEKVCTELLDRAKSKDLRIKGPVRLPTKNLKVCWSHVRIEETDQL